MPSVDCSGVENHVQIIGSVGSYIAQTGAKQLCAIMSSDLLDDIAW